MSAQCADLACLYGDSGAGPPRGDQMTGRVIPRDRTACHRPQRGQSPRPALINPHTSFYFRSELQMVSDEGLNTYVQ